MWKLDCNELRREWKVSSGNKYRLDFKKSGFQWREIIISYANSLRKKNATLEVNILGQYKALNLMNCRKWRFMIKNRGEKCCCNTCNKTKPE